MYQACRVQDCRIRIGVTASRTTLVTKTASICVVPMACGAIISAHLHCPQFAKLNVVSFMETHQRGTFAVQNFITNEIIVVKRESNPLYQLFFSRVRRKNWEFVLHPRPGVTDLARCSQLVRVGTWSSSND